MTIYKKICLSLITLTLTLSAGQNKELKSVWKKAYGESSKDIAYDAVETDKGNFLIAGITKSWGHGKSDILVLKTDKDGNPQFRFTFGGKKNDIARAITKTGDGNYIVVGSSESYTEYGDKDVYVVKFSKDGKKLWGKTFGGDRDDEAFDVVGTKNGGAIVVGSTESFGAGYKDGYILYIDKNGKEVWAKAVGGKDDDELKGIAFSTRGGFFVTGYTRSYKAEGSDFYLVKFDSHAKYQYKKVLGGDDDDEFNAIVATPDGGCAVTGWTKSFESKHKDIDIMRFAKTGKLIWHKIYGFKSKEWGNGIATTPEDGFVIAGTTKSFGFGNFDFYLLELNKKGSSIFANVYGAGDKDIANSIIRLKSGGYLVVGQTKSYGKGDFDFMFMKLMKK